MGWSRQPHRAEAAPLCHARQRASGSFSGALAPNRAGMGNGVAPPVFTATSASDPRFKVLRGDTGADRYSFGGTFSCRSESSRQPYLQCWGDNRHGQILSDATGPLPPSMTDTPTTTTVTAVGALVVLGDTFGCLAHNGRADCWGRFIREPDYLAFNVGEERTDQNVTTVSSHPQANHQCGVTSRGTVHCIGNNNSLQLGVRYDPRQGIRDPRRRLEIVVGIDEVVRVAPGPSLTYAIRQDGSLWCWGSECPDAQFERDRVARITPRPVFGVRDVVEVAMNRRGDSTCVRHRNGTVSCWGNCVFAFSSEFCATAPPPPWRVVGPSEVVELAADDHFAVLTARGDVWCWGDNYDGQCLPDGPRARIGPVRVPLPATP
jgi:Regulator of chromosome condensation (RCC1) repeat